MKRQQILVAEDDPLERKIVTDLLKQNGYEVISVEDGLKAWDVLKGEEPPAVVLLDWMMPGLDGPQLLDKIRSQAALRNLYVIFLTVKNTSGEISDSLNRGAQDFITKPFDVEELLARIRVAYRTVDLQRQLADRIVALEQAFRRISQLEGILPICASCKKIRDPQNKWKTVEHYLSEHVPVSFSHGYCPECQARLLKEIESM